MQRTNSPSGIVFQINKHLYVSKTYKSNSIGALKHESLICKCFYNYLGLLLIGNKIMLVSTNLP